VRGFSLEIIVFSFSADEDYVQLSMR